jgi:pyruvate kinase
MKIMAKIETKEALDNFEWILQISDWIIFAFDKIEKFMKDKKVIDEKLMKKCKDLGKPIIITVNWNFVKWKYQHINESVIKRFCWLTVDAYMIETILKEEESLDIITELSDTLDKNELKIWDQHLNKFFEKNEDFAVRDYIIYNAYRATKEIEIRAIVSYTENWYTTARLSSLNPIIPLISFTKNDETYRFLNMLRWVKWYKISQSFSYENLKRIWKEMIRIIFKWNISLDDKILIVQANEMIKDEKTWMINWLELYKFKNI